MNLFRPSLTIQYTTANILRESTGVVILATLQRGAIICVLVILQVIIYYLGCICKLQACRVALSPTILLHSLLDHSIDTLKLTALHYLIGSFMEAAL